MDLLKLRISDDQPGIRRQFGFEPLEPRLLFSAMPLPGIFVGIMTAPIQITTPIQVTTISTNGLTGSSSLSILNNRQPFAGIVGTFTDDHPADASAYSATIDWGDGSPTQQAIVFSDPTGGFDVQGAHTYVFGQYTPTITVTAPGENPGDAPRTLTISQPLSVFPPPTACEGFDVNAVNGQAFRGVIATYVGLDATQLDRYTANISWGDGSQSSAVLQLNSDGSVSVIGQHVYASPGFDNIQVVLIANGAAADVSAASAFCRATVANGFCAGSILNISPESGTRYQGNLAFFKFLGSNQDISSLRAEVTFPGPDGQLTTAPGTILPGDGGFFVAVDVLFTADGNSSMQVRVYDSSAPANPSLGADEQLTGLALGNIQVAGHLQYTPIGATMTGGVESRVLLGHLTSDDPGNLWNETFIASIDWGDGSDPSEGQLIANPAGGYDIYGTHTYPVIGYSNPYSFSVSVTETRTARASGTASGPFIYQISGGTTYPLEKTISVSAGSFAGFFMRLSSSYSYFGSNSGAVSADLYTGADLSPTTSDIIATVQWSDGTTTKAQINQIDPNHFGVFSDRWDLSPGSYMAVLSVTIGKYQQSAATNIYVSGPGPTALDAKISPVPANVFVGDHFHGIVATFSVNGPAGQPGDYFANLQIYGAVNLTTTIVANNDGSFSVVADFDAISTNPGNLWSNPFLTIGRTDTGQSTGAYIAVNITQDPARVTLTPEQGLHFRQRQLFTTTVATFVAPSPDDTPADFAATIDWGDGQTTTGVITEEYNGVFDITGSYGYVHNSGSLPLKVTVTDSAGRSIFAYSSIYLDPDPVSITPGKPAISQGTVSGNLANFEDDWGESSDPSEYRVYHAALIDWGDGSITSGLVTTNPDGTYSVASTHNYQADGSYQIHILVRRNAFYTQSYIFPMSVGMAFQADFADAGSASSIIADPDSDFGVTFYVNVVGIGDPAPAVPASTPVKITTPTQLAAGILFSKSAISPSSDITGSDLPKADSWLASDQPLLGSQRSNSDSPIDTMLLQNQ